MTEVSLRHATVDDATAMMQLHQDAIFAKAAKHYSRSTLKAWAPGPTPDRVTRVQQEIGDEDFIVIVAEADYALAGFGMILKSEGQLRALYTSPEAPKTTGLQLLAALLATAREAGLGGLTCDASLNSVPFYKQNGFRELGRGMHTLSNGMGMECMAMARGIEPLKINP